LPFIKANHKDILESIATTGEVTDEVEKKLGDITKAFVAEFNSSA
jgi:F0F1-type ATP synthase alpha subunit